MPVRIAIDAMGGDFGPKPVLGALKHLADVPDIEVLLVGDPEELEPQLNGHPKARVVASKSVIGMEESATAAIKKKADSSIAVAVRLAKEGEADAVVSPGHTGATMACAVMNLGRLEGVIRPAVTTILPTGDHPIIVLDVGANVDCKPEMFVDFAVMGTVYAEEVLGRTNPRVGLLSIGTESKKGNEQTLAAYPLLEKAPVNFCGNMEGRQIFGGSFDVVVCDGFVGNILLKFGEATAAHIYSELKDQIRQVVASANLESAALLKSTFESMFKRMDHEEYGGAPLLGVNGTCLVCHGGASDRALANAALNAAASVRHNVNQRIVDRLAPLRGRRVSA
ncbi:MAG: phosphate acyltransferase PlsX [Candidatus Omnitrophica bacterium]|nr:Phosphate acyltransferase [bacterium]NUN94972.1 phosphate acyltransferase PlsX [Candidatus Omnitrophota bacterium]